MDEHKEQENKLLLQCKSIQDKLVAKLANGKEKIILQIDYLKSELDLFAYYL